MTAHGYSCLSDIEISLHAAITITALEPPYRVVRENERDAEICFYITQGYIEAGTGIEISGFTDARSGTAKGKFVRDSEDSM